MSKEEFSAYRQVTVINTHGECAGFSGSETLGINNLVKSKHCIAAGNMLSDESVIDAMVKSFEASKGELTARLIAAVEAGVEQGGEAGPVHSAAVKVVAGNTWPLVDLRVDWADENPIGELSKLWEAYEPQMQAYATRAIDPRDAPSYGVPGNE